MERTTAATVSVPLTGPQRARLRQSLERTWRAQVADLTKLSLRLHDGLPANAEQALMDELATARHALRETEAALDRLETDRYGSCEACRTTIPWERLEALPHGRFCVRCAPA
jgi:DnaK suppressor protein